MTLIFRGIIALVIVMIVSFGCSQPENKKMKFYNKGNVLYEKGEYRKANLEYKNAIQIDHKFADAYYRMGMSLLKLADPKAACENFTKTVEIDPDHMKAHVEIGKLFLLARKQDKAVEKSDLVLQKDPKNEDAHILKAAVLLQKKNQVGPALEYLDKMFKDGTTHPDAFLLSATAHMRKGDVETAERVIKTGIEKNPKQIELYQFLSNLYLSEKRIDDTIEVIQKVISIKPDDLDLKWTLAGLYWDSGNEPKALAILEDTIRSDEKKEVNWVRNADFLVGKKRLTDAEKLLKSGLKKNTGSLKIRFALSDIYLGMNEADKAEALLKECLVLKKGSTDPDNIQAKISLAKIYLATRQIPEAEKLVEDVLQNNQKNVEAHYLKGNLLLLQGEGAQASLEFRNVVNDRPQFIHGYLKLADAYIATRQYNLALDTLRAALKVQPDARDVLRATSRILVLQDKYREAETNIRKSIATYPDDIEIRGDLGDFYTARQNFKQAENVYSDIIQKVPKNPSGYIKMGRLYETRGKPDKAVAEFEKAYALNPNSDQICNILVESYINNAKFSSAERICRERLKENPRDQFTHNLFGKVFGAQQNYKDAEKSFLEAISLNPAWPIPHGNLAHLYFVQGRTDDAIKKYQQIIQEQPGNIAAYLSLVQIYVTKKDFDKAIQTYRQLLAKQPNIWVAANDLAFLLSEQSKSQDDLENAMKLARQAQKLNPEDGAVMDTVGWIYYKKGDINRAFQLLSNAREKIPGNPVVAYHLGMACYKLGKAAEAKVHLKKAVNFKEDFPGKEEAKKVLAGM